MSTELYLGVDGGQSSTEAVIGDRAGVVLGRGVAGPCNHISGSEAIERFRNAIGSAVREACCEASITFEDIFFEAACLGLSGGPEDKAEHVPHMIPARHYKITHDAEIALAGALEGAPGIIVIAGTGSIAFGRNAAGQSARAGGWGYLFGDEGGAFDITRRAVRAALQMEEGWGPVTSLRERLLEGTGAASANELLHRFYTPEYPRSRVATFAPIIDSAAQAGDIVAQGILAAAAKALAAYASGVHTNLFNGTTTQVAYVGGVFASDSLRNRFELEIENHAGCRVQAPAKSPVEGALLLATKQA